VNMFHSTSFDLGRDCTGNPGMLSVDGYNMGEIIIFGLHPGWENTDIMKSHGRKIKYAADDSHTKVQRW
jgi:hypothetical protein